MLPEGLVRSWRLGPQLQACSLLFDWMFDHTQELDSAAVDCNHASPSSVTTRRDVVTCRKPMPTRSRVTSGLRFSPAAAASSARRRSSSSGSGELMSGAWPQPDLSAAGPAVARNAGDDTARAL